MSTGLVPPMTQPPSTLTPDLLLHSSFPGNHWLFVSGRKDATISETWRLGEDEESGGPILICKGEPHGYLRTHAVFANFDLELDWRFPKDPNGNSGILLFTSGDDRVWPASVQVQLHQPELGSTFPVGGAKSGNELKSIVPLAKPLNQWNRCEVRCRGGNVTVTINGHLVGEISNCQPASGAIGLQSEGSEIHFRAISIREIPIAQAQELPLHSQVADESQDGVR
ncbi:3-keto-disaccharide hydrolase [Planctomicrobium sp. SH661]|uniref:3-keto-disaccharide hydrolase n=1 Tax=Planctomicrobium sp. SH661 TaxID=3448124 RepID=UPI003F5BA0D4